MARTMVKTKHPFDNLLYWNEYINYINQEFSTSEENYKWTPQVDIKEKDGNYLLQMDIPGFSLKDIDINYKNGFLTIKGQKKALIINAEIHNHRPDSYSDNFKSVVRFPQGIEKKKIIKVLKDGILKIMIPVPSNLEEQPKTS
jgi:HSP20 family molecular chaperone IbpA